MTMIRKEVCHECYGTGLWQFDKDYDGPCWACEGMGFLEWKDNDDIENEVELRKYLAMESRAVYER